MSEQTNSLREAIVRFRGQAYVVRELNFAERLLVSVQMHTDAQRACAMMVEFGTKHPKLSARDIDDKPAPLVETLLVAIARLSRGETVSEVEDPES